MQECSGRGRSGRGGCTPASELGAREDQSPELGDTVHETGVWGGPSGLVGDEGEGVD